MTYLFHFSRFWDNKASWIELIQNSDLECKISFKIPVFYFMYSAVVIKENQNLTIACQSFTGMTYLHFFFLFKEIFPFPSNIR